MSFSLWPNEETPHTSTVSYHLPTYLRPPPWHRIGPYVKLFQQCILSVLLLFLWAKSPSKRKSTAFIFYRGKKCAQCSLLFPGSSGFFSSLSLYKVHKSLMCVYSISVLGPFSDLPLFPFIPVYEPFLWIISHSNGIRANAPAGDYRSTKTRARQQLPFCVCVCL